MFDAIYMYVSLKILYLYIFVLINPCRNDSSNTVYGGTKSPVSVSDEKSSSQSRSRLILVFVFMSYHKKVYWLQIYIIFEMVTILKVNFVKV